MRGIELIVVVGNVEGEVVLAIAIETRHVVSRPPVAFDQLVPLLGIWHGQKYVRETAGSVGGVSGRVDTNGEVVRVEHGDGEGLAIDLRHAGDAGDVDRVAVAVA